MESSRLFALLRGSWEFARAIRSTSDPCFTVSGVATFVAALPGAAQHQQQQPQQRSLRYTERGTMRQEQPAPASLPPLPPMDVSAEHVWHFPQPGPPPPGGAAPQEQQQQPQQPATAHVHFADGRHFFTLALPELHCGRSSARFTHYCHPDTYTGTLDVDAAAGAAACRLTLAWAISGPKKSTEILTTFLKLPEQPGGGAGGAQ